MRWSSGCAGVLFSSRLLHARRKEIEAAIPRVAGGHRRVHADSQHCAKTSSPLNVIRIPSNANKSTCIAVDWLVLWSAGSLFSHFYFSGNFSPQGTAEHDNYLVDTRRTKFCTAQKESSCFPSKKVLPISVTGGLLSQLLVGSLFAPCTPTSLHLLTLFRCLRRAWHLFLSQRSPLSATRYPRLNYAAVAARSSKGSAWERTAALHFAKHARRSQREAVLVVPASTLPAPTDCWHAPRLSKSSLRSLPTA